MHATQPLGLFHMLIFSSCKLTVLPSGEFHSLLDMLFSGRFPSLRNNHPLRMHSAFQLFGSFSNLQKMY